MSGSAWMLIVYVAIFIAIIVWVARSKGQGRSRDELKARGGGPGCIHCIGDFKLYPDRLETPHGTAHFRDGPVRAAVDTAGNLAVGRRATLTRMAAGGLLFGPLGAVVAGAGFKKDRAHDARELYLLVEAPEFDSVGEFEPRHGPQVREFVVDLHNAYRTWHRLTVDKQEDASEIAPAAPKALEQRVGDSQLQDPAPLSVADELAKLAALKEQGILTQEEFDAQKARLLD